MLSRVMRSDSKPLPPTLRSTTSGRRSERLRIILLSQYFPPEVGATQSRMQSFAEYLAAGGHQVTVICEFPNHPHGVIPQTYRGLLYQDDRSNPYRVLRVWVMASSEKTQLTRMAFYLSYMALATAISPLAGRADVVVATSPPLFTGLAGLALARLNRAPFVLDVRDLWPAAAVSLGPDLRAGLRRAAAEHLERLLYRQAAAVTTVTRPFCDHIDAILGGAALERPGSERHSRPFLRGQWERRQRTSWGFQPTGSSSRSRACTGSPRGSPSVLDSAERLNGETQIAFVGDGPLKERLDHRRTNPRSWTTSAFHPQVSLDRGAGDSRGE